MSFTFNHLRNILGLALLGFGVFAFYPFFAKAFMANVYFNSVIVAIFAAGVAYGLIEMRRLTLENATIAKLKADDFSPLQRPYVRLLKPIVTLFSPAQKQGKLTREESLEKLRDVMEESRENMRYFSKSLVVLGLMGIFWGVFQTMSGVSGVIQNLSGDGAALTLDALKGQMAEPIESMGIGLSSALFGIMGALLIGFVDLALSKTQGTFLKHADGLFASVFGEQSAKNVAGPTPSYELSSYIQVLWEKTLERLELLDERLMQKEAESKEMNQGLSILTERLSMLSDHMRESQDQMMKFADDHQSVRSFLDGLQQQIAQQRLGVDDSTRQHIRNIDMHLERFNAEFDSNRSQVIQEMRNEIRLLAKTIAVSLEPRNVNQAQVSFKEKA